MLKREKNRDEKVRFPLRQKLVILVLTAMIPLLLLAVYLIAALMNYSHAYDAIVRNMTIANNYNLDFKEQLDESIYKLVVGSTTFDSISQEKQLEDPYKLIEDLREEFSNLMDITTDRESLIWLQRLLRNVNTLEDRVDDIRKNLQLGGHYDENIEMLDNNIYILTELIQDDIQYYIYYQTKSIDNLTVHLNSQVNKFIILCIGLVVIIVITAIAIASFILRSISRPLDELCGVTEQIAKGDFSARAGVHTQDEIALLAGSVNDMSQRLEVMVQQIKEDERKMRYAELRVLQEQINPHFLYNTLDTIVWLIEGNNPDQAVSMVVSLSEFFRLVLSRGKEFITIQEEELHIRSYLEIQQVRYHDILEYEINIDPSLYRYRILKLTLQPLVENSLYHGIKYKRAPGKIVVTGRMQEDCICFTVEDNGVGMDQETLNKLRQEIKRPCKQTESGFGLANVNERIRMNFGQEYGMTIDSVKGRGTAITLVIPAVENETAKENRISAEDNRAAADADAAADVNVTSGNSSAEEKDYE